MYMRIGLNNIKPVNIPKTDTSAKKSITFQGIEKDTFVSEQSRELQIKTKFSQLFPNNEIDKYYNEMKKDFEITTNPKLNFVYDENSVKGGGYSFSKNSIDMNLYDLITSDYKIIGIKNGKKYPLVSPSEKLPLFVNKDIAKQFVETKNKSGSLGFDKLIAEEVTTKEQKKFILHKIAHECVHAKQHQILRETEGIDDRMIIRAWFHKEPVNEVEERQLNAIIENVYNNSPWKNIPRIIKYNKQSPVYKKSLILLNAIQNYPPVTSPAYTQNALEKEAFEFSAMYINIKNFK